MTSLNAYSKVRLQSVTRSFGQETQSSESEALKANVAEDERAAELAALKAEFGHKASSFLTALVQKDETYRRESAALLKSILRAIAPSLCRASAVREAMAIIEKKVCRNDGGIHLRAHPQLAADLAQLVQSDSRISDIVSLRPDGNLNPNAVETDWKDGGFAFDPDRVACEFLQLLEQVENDSELTKQDGKPRNVFAGATQ